MAMGQQQDHRGELMVGWAEMVRSAGSCVLRPSAVGPDRGRLCRLCRGYLQALLRYQAGSTFGTAGALFSDPACGLLRG